MVSLCSVYLYINIDIIMKYLILGLSLSVGLCVKGFAFFCLWLALFCRKMAMIWSEGWNVEYCLLVQSKKEKKPTKRQHEANLPQSFFSSVYCIRQTKWLTRLSPILRIWLVLFRVIFIFLWKKKITDSENKCSNKVCPDICDKNHLVIWVLAIFGKKTGMREIYILINNLNKF